MSDSYTVGAAATTAIFFSSLTQEAIPWLIASLAVIICDLVFGLRKSWLTGETIRFSKACRETMAKIVTYSAFVIMACAVDTATGKDWHLEMWACLLVCFIEGCSIMGNLLKPKGISIDLSHMLNAIFSKASKIDYKDADGIFTNDKDKNKEGDNEKHQ